MSADHDPPSSRQGWRDTRSPWPAVAAIWVSTSALAVWSPDMVSGSEHEHLPLGLITVWLWALVATAYALMTPRRASLTGWSLSVAGLWFGTLLVGLFAPLLVTGSDPTRIPLAVLLAPPVAAMLTGMLSLHEAGRRWTTGPEPQHLVPWEATGWEHAEVAGSDLTEAAAASRATELAGWNLVDHATRMVGARFSTYSVLHPWESPSAAFRRGRGYCTQYNGALAIILRELRLQAWLVYAPRVRFDDQQGWALGHTWVRVRVGGDVRDVCARSLDNSAGRVHFEPVSRVRKLSRTARWLTTTGSYGTAVAAIALARLHGRPRPEWVEHPRDPS